MNGPRFALVAGAAFVVAFVALNMIANVWLRDARLDLTENRLYTLSEGSRTVLKNLAEPLELRFYYSREAAGADPALSAYAARVRELLLSYAAHADGLVRVVEVNPEPDSEEEDEARLAGLQPLEPPGQDAIFLGVAGANAVDDRQAIAFLDPEREPFLEYDLTRLLYDLDNPNPPRVGLITTLPMGGEPGIGQGGSETTANLFGSQLRGLFEVETLSPDFAAIPEDIDVLAVIHPWGLSPGQLYAVDQFALSKGRVLVAVDPASLLALAPPASDPFMMMAPPAPSSSNLEPLLSAWGLALSPDVVMDREGGFVLGAGSGGSFTFPLFLQVAADRLSRDSLITAELTGDTVFGMAGALQVSEREGLQAVTLARTTGETMRIPTEFALQQPSPDMIDQMWRPTARTEILAVQLTGRLTSAYATGAPPEAGLGDQSNRLTATPEGQSAQIVVVADTDFLLDGFYFQQGQLIFDNLFFALNAVEALSGSEALISLRSRAPSIRRLTVLDEMEEQARADYQASLEAAEAEQAATEQRLRELQSRGQGSGFFEGNTAASLTPEEQSEINRFMTNAQALRDRVRDIRRDLRRATDDLQAWVMGLNLWGPPLLVGAVGVFVLTRHSRRRGSRGEEAKA